MSIAVDYQNVYPYATIPMSFTGSAQTDAGCKQNFLNKSKKKKCQLVKYPWRTP